MTVIALDSKTEQISPEKKEILDLIALAHGRATNGRKGDRALQQLIELQQRNIQSLIRKRLMTFPHIEREDLELAAVEGIIKKLETYDPYEGTFGTWAYYGILNSLDKVCDDHRRAYQAKLSSAEHFNPIHEDREFDAVLWETVSKHLDALSEQAQEILSLVCQGWRFTEIAKHLSKSADAVRMMFNRSIATIKARLNPPVQPQVQARIRISLRWLSRQLSKVVRKFSETRQPECNSILETPVTMTDNTSSNPKSQSLFSKFKQKLGLGLAAGAIATSSITLTAAPAPAQSCLGYMCGPFGVGIENVFFEDDEDTQKGMTGMFSLVQILLVSVVVGLVIWGIARAVKQESYTLPVIIFIIVVIGAFSTNYLGGLLVSQVNDNGIGFSEGTATE